jgi:hypothetical protein
MALLDEQAYIGYPQMGRRRAMPNRDVEMNQGLLRGASYYPYDLLGSPIDLINMGLKPLGMGSQKPVMGSDYLQSLAQQYGLSQQPTGSNAENVARLAMSAMNPATGARAVGRVIEPTMQALAPKAYGLLEDYMVKSGGINYAVPLNEYKGSHTAPNAKVYGGTLDNLGAIMPEDVYSSKGQRLYGIGDRQIDSEWFSAAYKAKGNPDRLVEVYRAVPKGVTDINQGDWVTTSKTYAKNHGERSLNDEYEIISKKVKANTLSSEGYPYEFGYNE